MKDLIREQIDKFKNWNQNSYYRATTKFIGNNPTFKPKNYYEKFDDQGNPILNYGEFVRSDTPEISASKTIGGAILGVSSMINTNNDWNNSNKIYIYSINQKPNKDLSHVRMDDFEYIKEVRYSKEVKGTYIGYLKINDDFIKNIKNFYLRFNLDDFEELTDEQEKMWNDFENYITTINEKDLKN